VLTSNSAKGKRDEELKSKMPHIPPLGIKAKSRTAKGSPFESSAHLHYETTTFPFYLMKNGFIVRLIKFAQNASLCQSEISFINKTITGIFTPLDSKHLTGFTFNPFY
jgi:hypothetical protein